MGGGPTFGKNSQIISVFFVRAYLMMSCTIVMMDDGIYKENDNHDNDDNDNEEQMLMQTPHYPPAETYCC